MCARASAPRRRRVVGAFETRHCSIRGSSIAQFHRIRVNVPARLRYRNPFAVTIDRSCVVIDRVRNFFPFFFFFPFLFSHWKRGPFLSTWPAGWSKPVGYLIWRTEVALCEKRKTRAEQLFLAYFDNDVRDFILMPNIFLPHFRLSTRVPFEEEEVFNARIIFLLFFFEEGKRNINIFFFRICSARCLFLIQLIQSIVLRRVSFLHIFSLNNKYIRAQSNFNIYIYYR